MKVLFWYASRFAWRPTLRTLESADEAKPGEARAALLAFVHVEEEDEAEGRPTRLVNRLVKQLKWLGGKREVRRVVLHSFSHLSESKARPELARDIFTGAREKLERAGYEVLETPFGHFNDLELEAPGDPLARVFCSW